MRILHALRRDATSGRTRMCEVAVEVTDVTGAGIMLMSGDYPTGSICSTDTVSRLIEDLQYSLGEGPCVDAFTRSAPVLIPDLASESTRWPAFGQLAREAGARAVFGFPLVVGAARVGALNLYRDRAGGLTDEQHATALVMADVAARAVLLLQADVPAGDLADELAGGDLHLVVHQAAGMVSVQTGTSVGVSLVRLRAFAFSSDRPLIDVARAIVARELRFRPGGDVA